jgi:TonB family protein
MGLMAIIAISLSAKADERPYSSVSRASGQTGKTRIVPLAPVAPARLENSVVPIPFKSVPKDNPGTGAGPGMGINMVSPVVPPLCDSSKTIGQSRVQSLNTDLTSYMVEVKRRLKQHWNHPRNAAERVVVLFTIESNGDLSNVSVQKGSGVLSTDEAALMAVRLSAPFAPLPQGAPKNVHIEFSFDANLFEDFAKPDEQRIRIFPDDRNG